MSQTLTLHLHSHDAIGLCLSKGQRPEPLLVLAKRAIARVYNRANGGQAYPWLSLMAMHNAIALTRNHLEYHDGLTDARIMRRIGRLPTQQAVGNHREKIEVGTAVHFALADCIRRYDTVATKMLLARSASAYAHQNAYFRHTLKIKRYMRRMLGRLVSERVDLLPNITVDDYLKNTAAYQMAAKTHGPINPEMFYLALISTVTPTLSPRKIAAIRKVLLGLQTNAHSNQQEKTA